jgi:HK97 family phage major capsid protein
MDMGPEAEIAWMKLFGRAAGWYEDYAFFQGGGAGNYMPLGIINAPGTKGVARASGNHISQNDLSGMTQAMIPFGWGHAIWCCSVAALGELQKATGFMPNQIPIFPPSLDGHGPVFPGVSGLAGTLLTRPMFVTEKLPALGTKGDLVFFDPTSYIVGDRMETTIDASPHPNFNTYQTIFRIWRRVDGKPMNSATMTMQDGSTTASPFVVLNA